MSISTPAGKARSITRLTYPIPTKKILQTGFLPFQRRYYADEPATQSEPEADDAIEEADKGAAASEVESADEDATEHASSAADSVKAAAQTAGEAVTGAAQSLGSAAGFGSQGAETNSFGAGGKTSKTVYVGNLFFDVKREDLAKEFSQAGPVTEAKIITDVRGLSKGFVIPYPTTVPSNLPTHDCIHILMAVANTLSIDTDSATLPSKPRKPPAALLSSSTCKTSKAAVSPSSTRSPPANLLLYASLAEMDASLSEMGDR